MKPAALEVKKAQTITSIEANLETLLKASGLEYQETNAPVKKPEFRQFQTLQRINAKLELYMSTLGPSVAADPSAVPQDVKPPAEDTSAEQNEQLDAEIVEQPDEAPVEEPAVQVKKKSNKNK